MTRLGRSYPVGRVFLPPPKGSPPHVTYDAVGAGSTGSAPAASFSFTATSGADVFGVVTWDRTGTTLTGATYGGVSMTQVGSTVLRNNLAANGGVAVFRLANAGSGSGQTFAVTCSGTAWWIINTISFTGVNSVSSATSFGTGTTPSMSLSLAGNGTQTALQIFSNSTSTASSFSGTTNRYNGHASGSTLTLGTATASGTASETLSATTDWAGVTLTIGP